MRLPLPLERRVVVKGAATAIAVAASLAAPPAFAGGMDLSPERLVLQPPNAGGLKCQDIAANPDILPPDQHATNFPCRPDNIAYRNLVSELGFALAPNAFHPARTTGFGGFSLTLETSFTKINADAVSTATDGTKRQYWHDGTQGPVNPNNQQSSVANLSPDSLIQVYSLKARKGLGLGFELAGVLGYVGNTSLWLTGADIRWSLLEGFRTGALGYFPDIAVGGGVRTVSGSSKFYLTTVGIDAQISKPITLADSAVLTPYIGYQRLFIFGDSTIVNSAPNVDALQQCGYLGNNVPGNPNANPTGDPKHAFDGQPICANRAKNGDFKNGAFNDNITFDKVRIHRHRGIVGLSYRYEILFLAGQFITDLTAPADENPGIVGDRQWTLSFEGGVFF